MAPFIFSKLPFYTIIRTQLTLEEANQKIHPSHSIIIAGGKGFRSLYEGTQSLNNAVRRYFEFLSHREKKLG